MSRTDLLKFREVAGRAGLSIRTVYRYAEIGVFEVFTGPDGRQWAEPSAPEKCLTHFQSHGAPGGRPIRLPGGGHG